MIFSASAVAARKERLAQALKTRLSREETLLVHSGVPIQKPGGLDQHYVFQPHPEYFWLTGQRRPHGVSAFSLDTGWVEFVLPVTREEKIWEGGGEELPGKDISTLSSWLATRPAGKIVSLGSAPGNTATHPRTEELREVMSSVRRVKDPEEVALVAELGRMAGKGYEALRKFIRPGVSERDIQLEYELTVLRAGAEKMPYESIVGSGTNGAILHALPTSRVVRQGELVLIDAGADRADYCVDITRVFPADGAMSSRQKSIFELVRSAQEQGIALCRPGVEWRDVHLTAARVMGQGLCDLGLLKCGIDEAIETGAVAVFFPHGVGHLVGLKVRDAGGTPNPEPKKYAGARVRVDMPLEENFIMTVEPGLYFIEALIRDGETRQSFRDQVNFAEAEKWLDFGGIRLEDDILVTSGGPQNLTGHIPK